MVKKVTAENNKRGNLTRFPLLPLRDIVVFPHMVVPLFVGREKSILALQAAMDTDKFIFLAAQKNAKTDDPAEGEIHLQGTLCKVIQLLNLPDGTVKVLVEGRRRGIVSRFIANDSYLLVEVDECFDSAEPDPETEALMRGTKTTFESFASFSKKIPQETVQAVLDTSDPSRLADTVASHLNLKTKQKQHFLSIVQAVSRLEWLIALMGSEIEILQLEKKIHTRVKRQMEKSQKEYYLNEQLKAIQKELGGKDELKQELAEIEQKISSGKLTKEAEHKGLSELKKLKHMSPMSAEAAVVRNYVDWLISLPWGDCSQENLNMVDADTVLNADHFGLEKVKERILEYLSVASLVKKMKGPILCLEGPPGVGKTSLARSIARATGRSFVKMSLGGVRDEAEIRGHRRTYVGAMPGKIIQNLKKSGSGNPVFLLDEIDKMSTDFRGDPASALLEVLDPEQNSTFNDHFLDVDYDLSPVLFLATANSLHAIPRPLLDRLEVIRVEGYTETEKLEIAKRYLVGKQLRLNGLSQQTVSFTDKALLEIIRFYTREAGVRNLEREIAAVCRKIAYRIAKGKRKNVTLRPQQVRDFLGSHRFSHDSAEPEDSVGVVTGLAWTETGGELLSIEVTVLPGKGIMTITGQLGEVMQESAHAAVAYVRSRASLLGLERNFFQSLDIHIHVPEGAIPKDGPSAGIAMATAVTSALTGRAVRQGYAMTGEITLRGRVLPIGGLKEKILAAKRGNVKAVVVPKGNEKDLGDMPKEVLAGIRIHLAAHMDEVLENVLSEVRVLPELFMPAAEMIPAFADAGKAAH
ncbi:MAG: endopeptidase La [Geobacteraceae bacterium]|nr:endopeptidase La [Geobacteraceae bacterium]